MLIWISLHPFLSYFSDVTTEDMTFSQFSVGQSEIQSNKGAY